jgi:hypothetical protein
MAPFCYTETHNAKIIAAESPVPRLGSAANSLLLEYGGIRDSIIFGALSSTTGE